MRFCIRLLSSGSVTSLQSSPLEWCFDEEELCFLELEDEEWCFDDEDPEGILVMVSFSVSESELQPWFVVSDCCESGGNWSCRGVVSSSVSLTGSSRASEVVRERCAIDSVTPDESSEDMYHQDV